RQRDIILDIFLSTHQHVSVEELYLKIKQSNPGIGFATVYRTLKLFAEAGLAREVLLHDGQTRYEHVVAGEHHDHLVCTGCNTIIEFEDETIETAERDRRASWFSDQKPQDGNVRSLRQLQTIDYPLLRPSLYGEREFFYQ